MKKSKPVKYFQDLYHYAAGPRDEVSQVLAGHLAIEFLLRKLIVQYDPKLETLVDTLSHARLIALSRDLGTLSSVRADLLSEINTLRNRFAHQLTYRLEISELSSLLQRALVAFSDYAEMIKPGLADIASSPSAFGLKERLLPELFLAAIYDLHQDYVARGGDEENP